VAGDLDVAAHPVAGLHAAATADGVQDRPVLVEDVLQ